MQREIKYAKAQVWLDLVKAVKFDPCRSPYGAVMRKLLPSSPPVTAEIESALLLEVIKMLFSPQDDVAPEQTQTTSWAVEWEDKWQVTEEELQEVTRRMAFRDVPPDPDGLSDRVWVEIMRVMVSQLRRLYTGC